MAAQQGLAIIVKIDIDGIGDFQAMAGVRTRAIVLTAEPIEITNSDSVAQYRELLDTTGVLSLSSQVSGVFLDSARDEDLRTDMLAQTNRDFQLIAGAAGTFEGAFKITNITYEGEYNGEATYSFSINSAGAFTFT